MVTAPSRPAAWIAAHPTEILVLAALLTLLLGSGLVFVETDTSLRQFEDESAERAALEYANANFSSEGPTNETEILVAVEHPRGEGLSRPSLLASLRLQRAIRADDRVGPTLVEDTPTVGPGNLVAQAILRREELAALEARAEDIQRRQEDLQTLRASLREALEDVRTTQRALDELNASFERGEINESTRANRTEELRASIEPTVQSAAEDLDAFERGRFERAVRTVRATESALFRLDRRDFESETAYERAVERLERDLSAGMTDGTVGVLGDRIDDLGEDARALQADRRALENAASPPLSAQLEALEAANDSTVATARARIFRNASPVRDTAQSLLPTGVRPGNASGHLIVVRQSVQPRGDQTAIDALTARHHEGQRAVASIVGEWDGRPSATSHVFGYGLFVEELDRALAESMRLAGGLAIMLILAVLWWVYRNVTDVLLTCLGLVLVLGWTLGAMGWAGIELNQAVVTAPLLLAGLSIDYGVHVLARYRERRRDATTSGSAMAVALAGIGPALALVTATTAIGFLANLVSPVGPVREFGLVSATGIISALVVFGVVVPATKVALSGRPGDATPRTPQWSMVGGGLRGCVAIARRRPAVLAVLVLVVTGAALGAGVGVDTELREDDYFADPLEWTGALPGPFGTSAPETREAFAHIQETYGGGGDRIQLLVRGEVSDPRTLAGIASMHERAETLGTLDVGGRERRGIEDPLTRMRTFAAEEPAYGAQVGVADQDEDGIPDRNVGSLYHELLEWNPSAAGEVIHRDGTGRVRAIRIQIDVSPTADAGKVTADANALARSLEGSGPAIDVVPTGRVVVDHRFERRTLRALGTSFVVTLVAILGVLVIAARYRTGRWSLGAVTLVPVVLATSWTLGTMALLDIPLNALTATIASLALGLGIAYSVHVAARFIIERERGATPAEAIDPTLEETGSTLLGSAATTVVGVAALGVASVPVLRQFGIIAGAMILYATLASLVVLPALLVRWGRWRT